METLNVDLQQSEDEAISLSPGQLKAALSAAYVAGKTSDMHSPLEPGYHSSHLFWRLMESLPDHVYFKDLESKFICVNRAHALFNGFANAEEVIGKSDFDIFQERFAKVKYESEQEIIRSGEGWSFREERDRQSDGSEKWVLTTKLPLKDATGEIVGTFGLSRDITESKKVEIELEHQRHLLQTIVRILPCRVFVRDTEQRFVLVNEEYRKGIGVETDQVLIGKTISEIKPGERAELLEARDIEIIEKDQAINNQMDFNKSLMGDKRWVLTSKVPLHGAEGKVEGVVGMTLDITEQKEAEEEARQANEKLQKQNQQLETELQVARQLQETLMASGFDDEPRYSVSCDEWSFEASYLYSPSHHLAGDFFYIIPISKDKVGILVCDVMGHGVKASLVTMLIRGLLLEIPTALSSPARVLRHLNDKIIPLADDANFPRFVTAVYTVFNLSKGEIMIANAGHPEPLWYVRDEQGNHFEGCPVREMGPALGMFPDEKFRATKHKLDQMTELLFFTDGLIEQKQCDGQEWGVDNLVQTVERVKDEPLSAQLKLVTEALHTACESDHLDDDVCLVAIRVQPNNS
ncbi:SpoIIE family protein phosphatase [bacterium]|nr:SpoIIE family protein phosphatase [bacterium]